jgi:peroxiredoxin
MESFVLKLKQIVFKTFHRNQVEVFDYDDLFADRRVLVLAVNNIMTTSTGVYMESFEQEYQHIIDLGIDAIYIVDSDDLLVGPWADKRPQPIIGLPDRGQQFVSAVAEHFQINKPVVELARHWQYMIVINNGTPEKLWQAPYKSNLDLQLLKSNNLRYFKLGPDVIKKYLVDHKIDI